MPTVLLIEDDAESRHAAAELFQREEWTTIEAEDGDAGISLALQHQPELILCDLLMPRVNGFKVCRSIRERLPDTKIIIVSGRDYGLDRKSAMEAGADEYLVKPISWEILHEVIERVLLLVIAERGGLLARGRLHIKIEKILADRRAVHAGESGRGVGRTPRRGGAFGLTGCQGAERRDNHEDLRVLHVFSQ